MSNTIDKRIVEMQFNNQQFENGVKTSLGTLEKLKQGLNLKNATSGLENLSDSFRNIDVSGLNGAVELVTERFSTLGIMGTRVLQNIADQAYQTGTRLVKSLSIDQLSSGFTKYEQKTENIQTLVNSTGKSMEEIDGYLSKLMWYSDETSYGFTDMTSALSTMSAAGGDIEKLVPMLMGMANATAFAGKGAAEFSRVVYNLGQSYGQGNLNLLDWKSVEGAGANSKQLVQELIRAGEELGKIKKGRVTVENFRDSLNKKWADRTVMETAFGRFAELTEAAYAAVEAGEFDTASDAIEALAENYDELAVRAFKSAQEAKSFTEAIDATKDAVSSGWMETFEIIFGNYEEAKELWTDLANALWDAFASGAEGRNEMLQEWKDLGGREGLIEAFWNAWQAVENIIIPIKDVFRDFFPAMTADRLLNITENLKNFTNQIQAFFRITGNDISRTFRGVFAVFDIFKQAITGAARAFAPLFEHWAVFGRKAAGVTGSIGDIIDGFADMLRDGDVFYNFFSKVAEYVQVAFKTITEWISKAKKSFEDFTGIDLHIPTFEDLAGVFEKIGKVTNPLVTAITTVKTAFSDFFWGIKRGFQENQGTVEGFGRAETLFTRIGKAAGNAFGNIVNLLKNVGKGLKEAITGGFSFETFFTAINVGLLGKLILKLKDFISALKKNSEDGGLIKGIKDIFGGVQETLESFQQKLQVDSLKNIAIAVGILAVSLLLLSSIDEHRLTSALGAVTVCILDLVGAMVAVNKLMSSNSSNGPSGIGGLISSLIPSGGDNFTAMIKIAGAVLIMAAALKVISSIPADSLLNSSLALGGIMLALVGATKLMSGSNIKKIGMGLIDFAIGIRILASALSVLSDIDPEKLMNGFLALSGMMIVLAGVVKLVSGSKFGVSTGAGIVLLAASMLIFTSVIKKLGELPLEQLVTGLISMASALLIIGVAVNFMPATLPLIGAGLLILSASLVVMAGAMKLLGSMSFDQIANALVALGVALGAITIACLAMKDGLTGAAAIVIIAGALMLLTPVLMLLGQLSLEQIGHALLALGGAFVVMGAAAMLLGPMVPVLLGLAGAIALLGIGVLAAGAGLTAFAVGITTLATAMAVSGEAIVLGIKLIIDTVFSMAESIGKGIGNVIVAIATAIGNSASAIMQAGVQIITALLEGIRIVFPQLVETGLTIISSILTGIASHIGDIATGAVLIVVNFVNAVATQLPAIIDAGINLMVNFIYGMSQGIVENSDNIMSALESLLGSIAYFALSALQQLVRGLPLIGNELYDAVGEMKDNVKSAVSDIELQNAGANAMKATAEGIKKNAPKVGAEAETAVTSAADGLDGANAAFEAKGTGLMESLTKGMFEHKVTNLGERLSEGFDLSSAMEQLGSESASSYTDAFNNNIDPSAVTEFSSKAVENLSSKLEDFGSVGSESADTYISSILAKESEAEKAGTELGASGANGVSGSEKIFNSNGGFAGDGFIRGLTSRGDSAYQAGIYLGQRANQGLRATLRIASPSKVMIKNGMYVVEGLTKGISKYTKLATEATSNLGRSVISAMSNSIDRVYSILDVDEVSSPVIAPVIDMTNVRNSADEISGLFNSERAMTGTMEISSGMQLLQNRATTNDVLSAIKSLGDSMTGYGDTYNINGITYDDGSNITDAVRMLVRAARVERRV